MQIRDRIQELRRVRASELVPNPRNWRTHPSAQRDALQGVLAEIGYADALLARELPDGRLELIDGHLRAETTPNCLVPVLVLDVDEDEAKKILVTHDPLTNLAEADQGQLRELIDTCDFASPHVVQMLGQVEDEVARTVRAMDNASERADVPIPESYEIVIECANETEQYALYQRLTQEGHRCRVLTL